MISFVGSASALNTSSLLTPKLVAGSSIPDIVLGNLYGIYIAKGNGDGTFQTPTQILPDYFVSSLQVADLNGDGKLDLALDCAAGVTTFLGNGDGTFGGLAGAVVSGCDFNGFVQQQMALADFNGDGKIDLASQNGFNGDVELAPGNGDGTFRATPLLNSSATPALDPQFVSLQVTGDITGSGNDQVVGTGNGTVLSGSPNGKGGFNYLAALPEGTGAYSVYPVLGDFNGDGKQDLILNEIFLGVGVALSNGDGTFANPVTVPVSADILCPIINVAVGDVNGDGKLDLVMAYGGDQECETFNAVPSGYLVALGNGDGTFKSATFTPSGEYLFTLALAPFHGAGKPLDMAVSDAGTPPGGSGSINPSVSILQGNGDGTFGAPVTLFNGSSSLSFAYQLLTDDFNQDGKADLTFFDSSETDADSGVVLYPGHGDGTFAAPVVLSSTSGAFGGTYTDLNNDGVPDLVFTGYSGLSVALGTGGGSFATPIVYFAPEFSGPVLAGSFLSDNTQSIIIGSAFYMNQGGTSLSVVPDSTTVTSGQTLTLDVPVQATIHNQPAPSGTITLYDGSTMLNSAPVSGFNFSTAQLSVGSHSIQATYSGDSHYYANTSPAVSITVLAAPDFTLTADPATVTVSAGQSASLKMTVVANVTLAGNVTFQCSGLPAKAACTFNPATLTVAASQSGSVALAITTQSSTSAQTSSNGSPFLAGYSIAVLLLFSIPRLRRNLLRLLLLFCAVTPFLGCGGSGSSTSSPTNPGTPSGTSTVTVSAAAMSGSTTITHTSTVTLVVQ
jgi:hypothetical protein